MSADTEFDLGDFGWSWALYCAERGDRSILAKMIRDGSPISIEIRRILADLVDGKQVWKITRGRKSGLTPSDQILIRLFVKNVDRKIAAGKKKSVEDLTKLLQCTPRQARAYQEALKTQKRDVLNLLAKQHRVSLSTIRDVVSKRKTFAEK